MIYIRGDIHGERTFLWPDSVPCLKNLKTKEDYLLIAGDAGLVFAADKEGIKEEEKNMAIEKEHGGVDVLVSHVPGVRAQRVLMPNSTPYYKEAEMHSFIDYLYENLTPSRSYFGHLHIDNNRIPTCPNTIALCNDYYEIFSGECVSRTDY